ncbi:hypothetical protein BJX65DRAFT_304328 [Aspergillus insuetus]
MAKNRFPRIARPIAKLKAPAPTLTRSTNRKRRASEPLESPHESKKQSSSLKARTCDACDQEERQQQKPGPSADENKSVDDPAPTTSNGDAEQETPSAEAFESASDPASQKYWTDWTDFGIRNTFIPLSSPAVPDVSVSEVVRGGWRASQGVHEFAYISFRVNKTTYTILFKNTDERQGLDRTIIYKCIGLFIKEEYAKIVEVVCPLVQVWFRPDPETFESFLPHRKIGLKLVPCPEANKVGVGRLIEFLVDLDPIDWECIKRRVKDCGAQVYELSDVTDFKELEWWIFEVTIGQETMTYKQALDMDKICRELTGLPTARNLGIRAPRLRGIIGADTAWGGILMPKVLIIGGLDACVGDSLAERQQWHNEISATIRNFHDVGCVYGDVKVSNALIDEDRRPWLIDFEGGHTGDCVDKDLENTVEGDLQGFERLREWLALGGETKDEPQTPA